ncbi:MAG: DUF2345 domain-containing protein [Fibrobacter sp.]|nr:DUF2345 domain-containing protein [Fibrobacter sp.]
MATKKCDHNQGDFEKPTGVETLTSDKTSSPIDSILSNIVIEPQAPSGDGKRINGIVVGRIIHAEEATAPMVDFPGNVSGSPIKALATVAVGPADNNRDVALAFVNGEWNKPVIIGFMHVPQAQSQAGEVSKNVKVESDGETVTISAEKEIVLKCGESSITLTKAGKVLLNGTYISSRSKGVNRMRGGSVLLN